MSDPIDRQIRELTTERPARLSELDELVRPSGEMDVWGDEDEQDDEDE